jgi:uncharacterized protein (TIGR02453 family)
VEFYEGLEADNSKAYWTAHKSCYEESVRTPMAQLLADLEREFGEGKVFRPHRDIRFSADKSPYKTHIGAVLRGGGYVQLSAAGLAVANGMYGMAPDQLERYRRAVAEDLSGERLVRIIAEVEGHGIPIRGVQSLKTAPRGFPKDHARIDLLRHKGLVAWKEWPVAAWLGTAEAKEMVAGVLRVTRGFQDWLETHVGPSTAPRERAGG